MAKPPDRGLEMRSVKKFRGISQYRNITAIPFDEAQDLLNVIVSSAGYLEKLRAPSALSTPVTIGGKVQTFIDQMFDFQQANGTRQLIATFLSAFGYYDLAYAFTQIDNDPADFPRWSFTESNNLLFGGNGNRMIKWTGAALQNWGIVGPVTPPSLGFPVQATFSRAANVVTAVMNVAGLAATNGFNSLQFITLPVGDTVKATVPGHADASGNVTVVSSPGGYTITYAANGANFGPTIGTLSVYTTPCSNAAAGNTDFNINFVQRINNVATVLFTNHYRIMAGERATLSGFVPPYDSLNGEFALTAGNDIGVSFANPGPDIPAGTAPGGAPKIEGGFTDIVGARTWRYSYGNSVTGEESVGSDLSDVIPNSNNGLVANVRAYLFAAPSPDPQVDTIFWYATLDSGSEWFLDNGPSGFPTANGTGIGDGQPDSNIDVTQRVNFINFPPPVSDMVSKWQSRIYVASTLGQILSYSGYEKVLRGRPESSFLPGNKIQLQVGAATIRGFGPLMNGVVIWDQSNKMFMFKGIVEDIVTDQPVSYSEQLEELPWQQGVVSHQTVQPTDKGIIWLGSDLAVHKWNGIFYGEIIGPRELSLNISPLLKRMTPAAIPKAQSAYFNFLEREWYVLLAAFDGNLNNNRIIFFDTADEAADNLGIWVSDIEADAICVREDNANGRHLLIAKQGVVYEIKATTTATNGLHQALDADMTKQLQAFWLSGYDGNDNPLVMKMYRWGQLVTDQTGFKTLVTLVDDNKSTLIKPTQARDYILDEGGAFNINWKAKRASVNIQFPAFDTEASVVEMSLTHIPLSARVRTGVAKTRQSISAQPDSRLILQEDGAGIVLEDTSGFLEQEE